MTSVAHLYEDFSTFAALGHMTAETTEDELENALPEQLQEKLEEEFGTLKEELEE